MAGVIEYDTLVVRVETETSNLEKLNASLLELEKVVKKIDFSKIGEVEKHLRSIAKIDFSNVSKGLQDIVSAFKAFNSKSFQKATAGGGIGLEGAYPKEQMQEPFAVKNLDLKFDTGFADKINIAFEETLDSAKELDMGLEETMKGLNQSIKEAVLPIEELGDKLNDAGFNSSQLKMIFAELNREATGFSTQQLRDLKQILIDTGVEAEKADEMVAKLRKETEKLDNGGKKGASGLKRLINQFTKIMRYRVIRKIIQEIYKALTEGIKNVVAFGGATKDAVDGLSAKFTYLKNSIGAMVAPLIQVIAPLLEMIMGLVGDIANSFADMFAGLSGQSTFAEATDDVKDLNKELKKTQSLGIDELNVFQQENNGGFVNKETSQMSGVFGDFINGLKDILGDIIPVIKNLAQSLRPILEAIGTLLNALIPIFKVIVNLFARLINNTMESVNSSLAKVIDAIASIFELIGMVLDFLAPTLDVLMDIISVIINVINTVISVIAQLISGILRPIMSLLKIIFDALKPAINVVSKILSTIFNTLSGILNSIGNAFGGVVKMIAGLLERIAPLLSAIIEIIGHKWIEKMPTWARVGVGVLSGGVSEALHFLFSGKFATGGFPEDGVFFANHNELVGKFDNGKTAVANNQQITDGIYKAVSQALSEGGRDITIKLDGYTLAKVVEKKQNNFGSKVMTGGNVNWGK